MSTPLWQAGHQYLPGDLVQPVQAPAASLSSITNPGFESGSTSWSLPGGATIESDNAWAGTNRCKFTGTAGDLRLENTTLVACVPGTVITAQCMYDQGGAVAGDNVGTICLIWFDASDVEISESLGVPVSSGSGGEWHASTITATAPAGTAKVAVGFHVDRTDSEASSVDQFTWNLVSGGGSGGLIYRAVQAAAGFSGEVEPAWPSTLGLTVVDNEVTWEAVQGSRVVWEAHPLLTSGGSEPTWPTTPGASVVDGTVAWKCISRRVEDEKCPNSRVVLILSSKVFAVDGDVTRFSATANPLDWSSENDAGYLPTGLHGANANEMQVLAPYRSNLFAMNGSGSQNWQIDPDPALMALLDEIEGVGSSWNDAAKAVANDLFVLTALGVRSIGIAAGAENLQAGDIGMPIDELVRAAIAAGGDELRPLATYYPGAGQYLLAFRDPLPFSIGGDIPDGIVDAEVSGAYTGAHGAQPYTFAVTAGSLPPGITMNSDGNYSGTFTTAGEYSWTVTGTDALGATDTLDDTSVVSVDTTAQALLTGIIDWWELNGDLTNEVEGGEDLAEFSTAPTYSAGLGDQQEAHLTSVLSASTNGWGIDSDFSWWGWINVVGTNPTPRVLFGLAASGVGFQHKACAYVMSGGEAIDAFLDDYDDADFPNVTGAVEPDAHYFVYCEIDWAAKTLRMAINAANVGTSAAVNTLWPDMGRMSIRPSNGTDTVSVPDGISRVACMPRKATAGELAWLYNNGNGRSYADVVAAGTP